MYTREFSGFILIGGKVGKGVPMGNLRKVEKFDEIYTTSVIPEGTDRVTKNCDNLYFTCPLYRKTSIFGQTLYEHE